MINGYSDEKVIADLQKDLKELQNMSRVFEPRGVTIWWDLQSDLKAIEKVIKDLRREINSQNNPGQ
jgi:conjugal transfer/entry exclusion protein